VKDEAEVVKSGLGGDWWCVTKRSKRDPRLALTKFCVTEHVNRAIAGAVLQAETLLRSPMPCGHVLAATVTVEGKPPHCGACERERVVIESAAAVWKSPGPCGHPRACLVKSPEGAVTCTACERETRAVAAAERRGAEAMREYALGICQAAEAGVAYSMIRDAPLWRVLQEEPPLRSGPSCVCDREHPLHQGLTPEVRPAEIEAAVAAERERASLLARTAPLAPDTISGVRQHRLREAIVSAIESGAATWAERGDPWEGFSPAVREDPSIAAAVAAERERCAVVVESNLALPSNRLLRGLLVDAIRAGPSKPSP
jgi:hypothetical protein